MSWISLGAGAQSSAMTLKALDGEFGKVPDGALFADTGWEPAAVYEWLDRLEREVEPFPIVRVSCGRSIRDEALLGGPRARRDGRAFVTLPYYMKNPDGTTGIGRRQCTNEYKLAPMKRHLRSLGATMKAPVEVWIGISTDEAMRMKPSRVRYIVNRWPLIEANLSRHDCQRYLIDRMGAQAPKSSCIGCPYHDGAHWARMRAEAPEEFEQAAEFDRQIRKTLGMKSECFVHQSLTPLGEIREFLHEKQSRMFGDAFGNECEGLCGT